MYWGEDEARYAEAAALKVWLLDYLQTDSDRDVIVIGDFNSKSLDDAIPNPSESNTIMNIESSGGFNCVSKSHLEYTTPLTEERYDHACLSHDLLFEEYIPKSWDVRREAAEAFPSLYLEQISNHCPVSLEIRLQDNDSSPAGDWGIEN